MNHCPFCAKVCSTTICLECYGRGLGWPWKQYGPFTEADHEAFAIQARESSVQARSDSVSG